MADKKKRTFDDDDLFKRKPYAVFLKNLILKCDDYHRDDDVKAYTIAMDSSWGTGKSVFLEKFESMLEQRCSDTICVVHYNAWKSDFWSNAFEPFAEALFSSECFAKLLIDQSEGKSTKKFISACKDFGIAFLKGQLEKQVDIDRLEKSIQGFKSACTAAIDQKPDAIGYSIYRRFAALG
ncbi:P-loop NTPase fold protein [Subdoligranulum variabile]|uniref:P-loop NTPase fold protein n=1 Tax=Subdoligranulum variabile TaxID=214851 RepID=UPI0026ECE1A2|nr:P-loop NTPase fold protein [Subdoligranulum variabile]